MKRNNTYQEMHSRAFQGADAETRRIALDERSRAKRIAAALIFASIAEAFCAGLSVETHFVLALMFAAASLGFGLAALGRLA